METLPLESAASAGPPAVAPVVAEPPAATVAARRLKPVALGIAILAVIAVVAALYLARAFFVPLLLGILGSYALAPVVDWLAARSVPRAAGAALVLSALVGGAGWAAFAMGDDASAMIGGLPEAARKVREHVGRAQSAGPTAMQQIQEAAAQLEGAATQLQGAAAQASGDKPGARAAAARKAPVREPEQSPWLRDYMLGQSALLFTVAAQAPIVLLLCYFLLASGEHFRRKLVQLVGPSLSRKKDAVRILEEIDTQIQRYLLVTVAANVVVGVGTWLAFMALGVENPGVWGIAAGVLHFIPYLGPVVFAVASGVAAFVQFGTAFGALSVAGASLAVSAVVGSLLVTWVQSRFARVNAAVLFIALLFFGWLWGMWGLLLGAPLLAIAKVICDRVESLRPAGELLGH
ncbi:MAG TPA: AI-2E family transporter [Usitatibacter sp.]|nr:AI-2E family transporter [Usitatibacter sp.]